MNKFVSLIILLIFLSEYSSGQEVYNQTDPKGLKQGMWVSKYPNGNIRYTGSFKNNQPVGLWKRYHENGKLKANLFQTFGSDKVVAELFDQDGILYAVGNYIKTAKDSTWSYFNGDILVGKEEYSRGVKNGKSVYYFQDGSKSIESNWVNGVLDGIKRSFYTSGKVNIEIQYHAGKRDGSMLVYYESGQKEVIGQYANDNSDGSWKYFDESGNLRYELKYKNGILLNPELLEKLEKEELRMYNGAKRELKDPANYIENPSEYIGGQSNPN